MIAELSRAHWRKSRHSGGGENCVEMARIPRVVAIRDSKAPHDGAIVLRPERWAVFAEQIKAGAYDL